MRELLDSIKGCLVGGAIGDAFGLPVEFYEDYEIFQKYGENGVTELKTYGGVAYISDDTQMTMFTLDGLLEAEKRFGKPTAEEYVQCVYESYLNWLATQDEDYPLGVNAYRSELLDLEALHHRRGPGRTCLTALQSGNCGRLDYPLNDSKGCGGIMRVAPVALYFSHRREFSVREIALIGAKTAAITHSHELGYIPAAYQTALLVYILQGKTVEEASFSAEEVVKELFVGYEQLPLCLELAAKARELARLGLSDEPLDDLDAIRLLGQGWVAEETLAIALYCALRYANDFKKAIIAAANHSGDSDSTAAVTGNIIGAYLGLGELPEEMVERIEFKDVLRSLAEKIFYL